jgi:DNA replication protein DnaC
LARALTQKACRDGYTALFVKASEVFRELAMSRADGSHGKTLQHFGRVDLLVVDDWAMTPLSDPEWRDFPGICDARYQARSTLLTSQLKVNNRHAQIGDPTIADSLLDRLVHNAHRIELDGESLRKNRRGQAAGGSR